MTTSQAEQAVISEESPVSLKLALMIGAPILANVGLTFTNRTQLAVMSAHLEAVHSTIERIDRVGTDRLTQIERDSELDIKALKVQVDAMRVEILELKATLPGDR